MPGRNPVYLTICVRVLLCADVDTYLGLNNSLNTPSSPCYLPVVTSNHEDSFLISD